MKDSKAVHIVTDSRETNGGIPKRLAAMPGVTIESAQLEMVDFLADVRSSSRVVCVAANRKPRVQYGARGLWGLGQDWVVTTWRAGSSSFRPDNMIESWGEIDAPQCGHSSSQPQLCVSVQLEPHSACA